MDDITAARTAGQVYRSVEPLHTLVYFVPEAATELTGAGLRPGRMTYFASRSAPMGAVGPGTVAAAFYNFNPEIVARHIPRAWTLATPQQVLDARLSAVDGALRRLLGDEVGSPEVVEAAALAREAALGCNAEGRPLYAGHADLPWPSEPHLVLWHAATLLREHRGDGHIAALVQHGLGGLDALVSYTAMGRGFTEASAKLTRGWSDEEWAAAQKGLHERGLLDEDGKPTQSCVDLRADLEDATDRAAVAPYRHLGEERSQHLRALGKQLSRAVIAAGAFPVGVFNA